MRRLARIAFIALAVMACLYGALSWDWCRPSSIAPHLAEVRTAEGTLKMGAAAETMHPPLPIVVAGYPLPHGEADGVALPLRVRALVLEVANTRVAIVSVDLLAISEKLTEQVRAQVSDVGLSQLWLVPTHSHSSFGGYDSRPMAEAIGTGFFRKEAREAILAATTSVIRRAAAGLANAQVEYGEGRAPLLVAARSEGLPPDGRLGVLRFWSAAKPIAEVAFFGAHPTLVPRQPDSLNPDYPGFFSWAQERADGGIAMVLQTGLGNSTPAIDPEKSQRAENYAGELRKAVQAVVTRPISGGFLGWSRTTVMLPHADASRIVPSFWLGLLNNVLCYSAPRQAEISALRLGNVILAFVPGEPTAGATERLLAASHANQVIALANGYIGYIDTEDMLKQRQGESIRQYFAPGLLKRLVDAAALATQPLLQTEARGM